MARPGAEGPAVARLCWGGGGEDTRQLPLLGELYRIGRDGDAEIRWSAAAVSKQHARLERRGRRWLLVDQGSTNGLWWHGRRVQELLLLDGDRVQLAPPGGEGEAPWLRFEQVQGRRLRALGRAGSALLAGGAALGLGLLGLAALQLPIGDVLAERRGPLLLYDRQNRPMTAAESSSHREQTSLAGYPAVLIDALLASEDNRFWWHPGVDPIGTGRALLVNLLGGRVREGGSTLTQQLARSLYPEQVGQGDSLDRKWRELLVALQLEARHSKGELLLSYLNRVYLGAGWGFEQASRQLFAKPASQLSVAEAALLVGLLPSPNGYNPCSNPQAALDSRNQVLLKMVDNGRLSAEAARRARREPIALAANACGGSGSERRPAPFYSDQVRRDLEALVGADVAAEGNFLVSTHFDPLLQEVVERRLQELLKASGPAVGEGAVVVLDSRSGGILAIAGGRDYSRSQYNRASMALRQSGSTFKLFPYLAALERGAQPGDAVNCGPLDWGGQAFASSCGGQLSLRSAFAASSNTAALRLARRLGLEQVAAMARRLGISTPLEPVPGLVLGQAEGRLVELTAAYAAVANDGVWHAPTTIRQLSDAEGRSDSGGRSRTALNPGRRVLSRDTARRMQVLLQAVVDGGTGGNASLGGAEGGKTGTTNEGRDLLFVGYEPQRHWTIGIWLGNDDNSPTGSGSALAAGLWADIVRSAGQGSLAPRTRL